MRHFTRAIVLNRIGPRRTVTCFKGFRCSKAEGNSPNPRRRYLHGGHEGERHERAKAEAYVWRQTEMTGKPVFKTHSNDRSSIDDLSFCSCTSRYRLGALDKDLDQRMHSVHAVHTHPKRRSHHAAKTAALKCVDLPLSVAKTIRHSKHWIDPTQIQSLPLLLSGARIKRLP